LKWERKRKRKRKKNERRRVENKHYYFQEKEDEQNLFKETVPSTPEMTTNMDAHHAPGLKFDRELYADAFIPNCHEISGQTNKVKAKRKEREEELD
jgi:hypothetical protein